MTKTVVFQGIEYEVPDWARWIAQDGNGEIWAVERKPIEGVSVWLLESGEVEKIGGPVAPMVLEEIK